MARPRTFDETAVVAAARDRFWSSGYAGTGMSDLMDATGLSKASLYNTFGNKHTLYMRAFADYCSGTLDAIEAELDVPDDEAAGRLCRLIERLADSPSGSGGGQPPPTACFLAKAPAELAAQDPEVAHAARQTYGRLEELLVRGVAAAQRAGAVSDSHDARSMARHVLVALRGIEALTSAGVEHTVVADAAASLIETVFRDATPRNR
ncbi:AcrR family transcriptional regulator [Lipingzhangella halophila]|uniref:AcrR family transcriptional regulator n=1 Tax=Lipingzhangella halophila TaxID=1783352 RepID=A0A7W7W565_9ACTN|nr:TetR/AcrR family transcriptional regulator [Lipingzhangella halophila]MBB4934932.1 AcrR family transcriptional regulator [Lipingzhangella halophila]